MHALLFEERLRILEAVRLGLPYDPYKSLILCLIQGVHECMCPPGGPMGCCPFLPDMTDEEWKEARERVAKEKARLNKERLDLLRKLLLEEYPDAASLGDPLDMLTAEYEYLTRKCPGGGYDCSCTPGGPNGCMRTPPWYIHGSGGGVGINDFYRGRPVGGGGGGGGGM